jgi:hypothetical protein
MPIPHKGCIIKFRSAEIPESGKSENDIIVRCSDDAVMPVSSVEGNPGRFHDLTPLGDLALHVSGEFCL